MSSSSRAATSTWGAACALALACAGCHLSATPRSGAVAPRGHVAASLALETLSIEPKETLPAPGARATYGWYPDLQLAVRGSLGRCELGGVTAWGVRHQLEARCALLQERWGHPLSIAFSGAAGVDLPSFQPLGRVGVDISRELGPLVPMVDVYLSTAQEVYVIHLPSGGDAPFNYVWLDRRDVRLTVPFALGVRVTPPTDRTRILLVLGAVPYFVLGSQSCPRCAHPMRADGGIGFTVGIEVDGR